MAHAAEKDGLYGWVMVAMGGLMGCITIGAVFSMGLAAARIAFAFPEVKARPPAGPAPAAAAA